MEMQMPTPGPEHDRLARLSGNWAGRETMMASMYSPHEETRHATTRARMLGGFFVISDYEQRNESGEVTFEGHGVYSYDPATSEYKMYWFDSMGGAGGVASGTFEGNQLTFENTSPMGRHRYRYTFTDGNTRFEMSMSSDGTEWTLLMRGDYQPAD